MANPNIVNVTTITGANAGWNLSGTLTASLLTVATGYVVKINSITVANVDSSAAYAVDLYIDTLATSGATGVTLTGADATVYIAKAISVPANATLTLLSAPIYLMEGNILKGGGSTADKLDLIVSYEIMTS
jgi:hypothetical protein